MRAPLPGAAQASEGKLVIEIVAAFNLEDCLIAVRPPSKHCGQAVASDVILQDMHSIAS
jgi:hypothetical protein